jgi:putative spermidine/putrescine transport system permease protein
VQSGGVELARVVRMARRRERLGGYALVAPAVLFLVLVFFAPIALFAWRSVDNSEAWYALPKTRAALSAWTGAGLPPDPVFSAFAEDVQSLDRPVAAALARRLNYSEPGLRSIVIALHGQKLDPLRPVGGQLIAANPRWGETRTWQVIAAESGRLTSYYLLRALDLEIVGGRLSAASNDDGATFRAIFARTFWIGVVVTLLCLIIGFPVAYVLATAKGWLGRVLFIAILLPFWTSVLVRTMSWILLLQQNGILNRFLIDNGVISQPLALIYNRTGVYIAMVHVLLPFFVLPLYGVMQKVDRAQLRAAASLGARPLSVFRNAYLPQVVPGVLAGLVLVFVTSIGFYITPVLVGGGGDQMVSYFVAFYTNSSVNWGMAAALGTLLLIATLAFLGIFRHVVGIATVARR